MKEARDNYLYLGKGIRSSEPYPFISSFTVPSPSRRKGIVSARVSTSTAIKAPLSSAGLLGHTGSLSQSVPEGRWS